MAFYWNTTPSPNPENLPGRLRCGTLTTPGGATHYFMQPTTVTRIEIPHVVDVAIQSGSLFALTSEGDLYGWGDGWAGVLGNSDGSVIDGAFRSIPVASPTLIQGLSKVRQIGMAQEAVFALQADGKLMAWGRATPASCWAAARSA